MNKSNVKEAADLVNEVIKLSAEDGVSGIPVSNLLLAQIIIELRKIKKS